MQAVFLAAELLALYVLSQSLTQAVYELTILLFRARSVGITVVTLLTFPGTVVHELSHLFTAEVLGVRTGKLTLVPENIRDDEVKTGSVFIVHTDPFRRYAIGLAPIVWGIVAISTIAYFIPRAEYTGLLVLLYYLLFAVSNAMFSSSEDLKGFLPFLLVLSLFIGATYLAGIRIGLTGPILTGIQTILASLVQNLGVVVALNTGGLIVVRILIALFGRLTGRTLRKQ